MVILIFWAIIMGILLNRDPLGKMPFEENGEISGRVDFKKRRKNGFVYTVKKAHYSKNRSRKKTAVSGILIYSDEQFPNEKIHIGDKIKFTGKIKRPNRARNPGEFD